MVRSLQPTDPTISDQGTLMEWYPSAQDHLIWAKKIDALYPTSSSEILEHPPKVLWHLPAPESSPSSPDEQFHLSPTPGSMHTLLSRVWGTEADILFFRGTIGTKQCMRLPSKPFTKATVLDRACSSSSGKSDLLCIQSQICWSTIFG
eukprot:scaffold68758_cov52-Attheya_sp.AAC.6